MHFWQGVSFTETDQIVEIGKHCESVGFYGIGFAEHLATPVTIRSRYPYTDDGAMRWDATVQWPDVWSMATAVATHTTTLQFATTVSVLPLHHPLLAAKAVGTAAHVSRGRVVNGDAVGWMKEEFDIVGVDFHTRGRRCDEMLAVMEQLLTGRVVEHSGEFFKIPPVQISPVPEQRIPVWVGGDSAAAIARAVRHDGWIGGGPYSADELIDRLGDVHRCLAASGRSADGFRTFGGVAGQVDLDTLRRLADAGLTDFRRRPAYFDGRPRSTIERQRSELSRFAEEIIHRMGEDRSAEPVGSVRP